MAVQNTGLTRALVQKKRTALRIKPRWANQNKTLQFSRKHERVLDTSDPGTGKTRAHLDAFAERRRKKGGCALVLCPATLMETAWDQDAREFVPDMYTSLAYATNREKAFSIDADIYITNIDAVNWLAKQPPKFFTKFDTLIIDELTAYKHRTSNRSKAVARIRRYFPYRTGMTGTMISITTTEAWHQAFLIDDGQRLGTSFFNFRSSVCQPEQIGPLPTHIQWVDKPGAEEAVAYLLKDITIRHDFDDCMDIPLNHVYKRFTSLPAKLMEQYKELEDTAILELQTGKIVALNAAIVRDKLLQLASGAVYDNEGGYKVLDTYRYEYIIGLIKQRKHSVTFFNWTHQKEQLKLFADAEGIEYEVIDGTVPNSVRKDIVAAYQAGEFQTLFLHPKTGAHGLTLTRGTRTIWASPTGQPDYFKQAKHRIYRGGQKQRTETILVAAKGTVEKLIYDRLNKRNVRMFNFLDVLKERRK